MLEDGGTRNRRHDHVAIVHSTTNFFSNPPTPFAFTLPSLGVHWTSTVGLVAASNMSYAATRRILSPATAFLCNPSLICVMETELSAQ